MAFDAPPGAGEVALNLASSEFISFDDDPPSYDIIVPTFFTAARARQITVRVRDDWAWNYTLNADFYIVQPLDEIIGAGWTPL